MFGQESTIKPKYFNVYVARETNGFAKNQIVKIFKTCIDDVVYVLINEAKRSVGKLGNGHFIATDDSEIAQQYGLTLIETKYQ